jgi:hypothetical protein
MPRRISHIKQEVHEVPWPDGPRPVDPDAEAARLAQARKAVPPVVLRMGELVLLATEAGPVRATIAGVGLEPGGKTVIIRCERDDD